MEADLHNDNISVPLREQTVDGGARDGAVVTVLASHQCGPGSNPGLDSICGLSLLLVLSVDPRGFSPGTPLSPLLKNQHFQTPVQPGIR